MRIEKLIFYNHFGAGDIFESREFVLEWMRKVPADEFYYAHGKNPKILRDIPQLKYMEVTPEMNPMQAVTKGDGTLMVNTWIGRNGKYVLPGIGCVVEQLYRMHNDMLKETGLTPLERKVMGYIPTINFGYYNLNGVDEFVRKQFPKRNILISNGNVQSNQAENFDMVEPILTVAEKWPEHNFIITQPFETDLPNVFTTSEIIQDTDGFDLNEIAYLSYFCDTIIGRNSGPHVFSQHLINWMNPIKAIQSFTYREIAATFVLQQPVKMKKYWSGATGAYAVAMEMEKAILRG